MIENLFILGIIVIFVLYWTDPLFKEIIDDLTNFQ